MPSDAGLLNAWIWLGFLAIAACIYVLRLLRQSDYGLWETILYTPTYLMSRLLWRVHFTNSPPPEIQHGAVLVANHRSSVDPFFVQLAAKRRVHWMVANEYCKHFLFGPLLRLLQVIPTNRSGMDTAATKAAIRLTREGRLVGMFPEGRLNHTTQPLLSIRSGAALVAARAGVPIVPLFIKGSPYRRTVISPVFMSGNVEITFGEPIFPPAMGTDVESSDNLEDNSSPPDEKANPADGLILHWAKQIVTLAGEPSFPIELASKRKRVLKANHERTSDQ